MLIRCGAYYAEGSLDEADAAKPAPEAGPAIA